MVGLVVALLLTAPAAADEPPLFRNPEVPLEARVADLVGRLTLEEKAALLNHRSGNPTRFGIRSDQWNQCLNGVKWDRPTTLFPACIALAATWDTALVHEVAGVLADEARAIYNGWHQDPNAPGEHKGLIYRAPVINIGRNPNWGRNHEAWGEDPRLTGAMAVAYVRGLNGDDPRYLKIAATLKHYAVNNVETDRTKLDAHVPVRALREYWLPHFRDAIVEGGAQSVMASYNALNGTPNNINHWLLTDVLKGEWHHQGFVVSDLGGVRTMVDGHSGGRMSVVDAVAQSVTAGCDFSDAEYEANIPAAVRAGKLSPERLDDALSRVLRVRFRLGEFDPPERVPYSRIPTSVIGSAAHRAVALRAAQRAVVLLTNRDKTLPLDRAALRSIAVIGPLADRVVLNGYNGRTGMTVSALAGLRDRLGPAVPVRHEPGCSVTGQAGSATQIDNEAGFAGGRSLKFDAAGPGEYIEFVVDVPQAGGYAVALRHKSFPSRGIYQLAIDGRPQGEPVDFYAAPGDWGQTATFGQVELTAGAHRLRFTVTGKRAAATGYSAHFDQIVLSGPRELRIEGEQARFATGGRDETEAIAAAVAAAKASDVAVVCVGTDAAVEQEGRDRAKLGLTGRQEELALAVIAANPRTVIVQMSAGPLTVPRLAAAAPALVQAWWAGEEGGHALADVLLGDVNPAGRLPHTVYADESQVPPRDEYDPARGFTYMYCRGEPLFAFGHGLSYTRFEYGNLRVEPGASLRVLVDVRNAGVRAGDEVVQVYLKALDSRVPRPAQQLQGFARLALAPGETKTVTVAVPVARLAYWDEATHAFIVEPGRYEVRVGASSADIRVSMTTTLGTRP